MNTRTTLSILAIILLAAASSLAKPPTTETQPTLSPRSFADRPFLGGTMLQPHPLVVEMQTIMRQSLEKEDALLAALKEATTEKEMENLLTRLTRLETDRELDLLKAQARYARKMGRYELEREIKGEIVALLAADAQAIQ